MSTEPLDEDKESAVRAFFARAFSDLATRPEGAIAVMHIDAPVAPLEAFLRATPRDMGLFWHPPNGPSCAAAGVCARVDLKGEERLNVLRRWAEDLFSRLQRFELSEVKAPSPRIFGGIAFAPRRNEETPWEDFGDGCFTLPRWTYSIAEGRAHLSLAVRREEDTGLAFQAGLLSELDSILEALEGAQGRPAIAAPAERIPLENAHQQSYEDWNIHIEKIRSAIVGGGFEKIVAARRCDVDLPAPLDDVDVLVRLSHETHTVRFGFRREHSTFLGASPETLFAKEGADLVTEALAGTIRSLGSDVPRLTGQANRLLGSHKDLSEHAFVVREIRESLTPIAEKVVTHEKPQIRKVRDILHLNTAISARLLPTTHVADLLAVLHPTPAVGGAPTRPAAEWIVDNEKAARGWYTGTVGWIDADGDGVFAVAIRCGVITPKRAYVFTGAGIVEESDAEAEYAETSLKQQPFLRALGVL